MQTTKTIYKERTMRFGIPILRRKAIQNICHIINHVFSSLSVPSLNLAVLLTADDDIYPE